MEYICRQLKEKLNIVGDDFLPSSRILAEVQVTDCLLIVDKNYLDEIGTIEQDRLLKKYKFLDVTEVGFAEWHYGDFTPGRFAWKLEGLRKIQQIDNVRGLQGIWNYEGEVIYV